MRTSAFLSRQLAVWLLMVTACQSATAADTTADPILRGEALLQELPRNATEQQQRLLTAATLFLNAQAYAKALETLNRIDTAKLDRALRGDYLVAVTDAALGAGNVEAAWLAVSRPASGQLALAEGLPASDHARVGERRARVLEKRGQYADAIRERVLADALLSTEGRRDNALALWSSLQKVDRGNLAQLQRQPDTVLAGWASLAAAWRESADSPVMRSQRLHAWMEANAAHPAAASPPAGVAQALATAVEIPAGPATIALLLPQHGKLAAAGTAIQRGFLAAWFQARENGLPAPSLQFFDSSRSDFLATYDAAVAAGAQLVIGPLEKENLRLLLTRPQLPVATLALNYPDSDSATPGGLFFLGLAGEDEAAQVARESLARGLSRAAILYPDAEWGQRIAREFETVFSRSGGRVAARSSYANASDYGDVVKRLLDPASSIQRHRRLVNLLGADIRFEARRRQDIDTLLLVANTPQAVQLAPAIRFHYGNDLPTVATSHINSQRDANASGDLDGIRFVEMPWIVNEDSPLRLRVADTWTGIDERLFRLYALGIDALRVGEQLPLLGGSGYRIEGATGVLTLGAGGRIGRELQWMTFRGQKSEAGDDTR